MKKFYFAYLSVFLIAMMQFSFAQGKYKINLKGKNFGVKIDSIKPSSYGIGINKQKIYVFEFTFVTLTKDGKESGFLVLNNNGKVTEESKNKATKFIGLVEVGDLSEIPEKGSILTAGTSGSEGDYLERLFNKVFYLANNNLGSVNLKGNEKETKIQLVDNYASKEDKVFAESLKKFDLKIDGKKVFFRTMKGVIATDSVSENKTNTNTNQGKSQSKVSNNTSKINNNIKNKNTSTLNSYTIITKDGLLLLDDELENARKIVKQAYGQRKREITLNQNKFRVSEGYLIKKDQETPYIKLSSSSGTEQKNTIGTNSNKQEETKKEIEYKNNKQYGEYFNGAKSDFTGKLNEQIRITDPKILAELNNIFKGDGLMYYYLDNYTKILVKQNNIAQSFKLKEAEKFKIVSKEINEKLRTIENAILKNQNISGAIVFNNAPISIIPKIMLKGTETSYDIFYKKKKLFDYRNGIELHGNELKVDLKQKEIPIKNLPADATCYQKIKDKRYKTDGKSAIYFSLTSLTKDKSFLIHKSKESKYQSKEVQFTGSSDSIDFALKEKEYHLKYELVNNGKIVESGEQNYLYSDERKILLKDKWVYINNDNYIQIKNEFVRDYDNFTLEATYIVKRAFKEEQLVISPSFAIGTIKGTVTTSIGTTELAKYKYPISPDDSEKKITVNIEKPKGYDLKSKFEKTPDKNNKILTLEFNKPTNSIDLEVKKFKPTTVLFVDISSFQDKRALLTKVYKIISSLDAQKEDFILYVSNSKEPLIETSYSGVKAFLGALNQRQTDMPIPGEVNLFKKKLSEHNMYFLPSRHDVKYIFAFPDKTLRTTGANFLGNYFKSFNLPNIPDGTSISIITDSNSPDFKVNDLKISTHVLPIH